MRFSYKSDSSPSLTGDCNTIANPWNLLHSTRRRRRFRRGRAGSGSGSGAAGVAAEPIPLKCFTVDRVLRQLAAELRKVSSWFCGLEAADPVETTLLQERLQRISSLRQNSRTKLFLNLNAVVVLLLGVFMFVYFSVPQTR